jgi:pilus assembly protein CpaF
MLYRLEAMFLQAADFPIDAIRRQIAEGIDIIVHLGRLKGGGRAVLEIAEILGFINGEIILSTLFARSQEHGLARKSELEHTSKLETGGFA